VKVTAMGYRAEERSVMPEKDQAFEIRLVRDEARTSPLPPMDTEVAPPRRRRFRRRGGMGRGAPRAGDARDMRGGSAAPLKDPFRGSAVPLKDPFRDSLPAVRPRPRPRPRSGRRRRRQSYGEGTVSPFSRRAPGYEQPRPRKVTVGTEL
jgi:hypothetical protein